VRFPQEQDVAKGSSASAAVGIVRGGEAERKEKSKSSLEAWRLIATGFAKGWGGEGATIDLSDNETNAKRDPQGGEGGRRTRGVKWLYQRRETVSLTKKNLRPVKERKVLYRGVKGEARVSLNCEICALFEILEPWGEVRRKKSREIVWSVTSEDRYKRKGVKGRKTRPWGTNATI